MWKAYSVKYFSTTTYMSFGVFWNHASNYIHETREINNAQKLSSPLMISLANVTILAKKSRFVHSYKRTPWKNLHLLCSVRCNIATFYPVWIVNTMNNVCTGSFKLSILIFCSILNINVKFGKKFLLLGKLLGKNHVLS